MEDIIDIIVTETTNTIEITSQSTDEVIDVNIIDNREDITLNVTPTLVEININSLTGNFGVNWGDITGTLSNQTDLNTALGLKADLVGGKVPSSQLPSYVDDVVEVANYASLPATGETGKIYVTIDTNYIYRWTGSVYVEIKDSSAVWGAITGTLSSQTDLQSALNAKQNQLNGTGFVKASGTSISYDNTSYLPTTLTTTANTILINAQQFSIYGITSGVYTSGRIIVDDLFSGLGYQVSGIFKGLTIETSGNAFFDNTGYVRFTNSSVRFDGTLTNGTYTYTLPSATGTLALTSQLHNAVTIGTANGLTLSTQVLSLGLASGSANGALSSTDWTTFNSKQAALSGTGFVKISGTTISYDNSTYLTTSSAASTYVSGSGTTNYLPRWSSSMVLTDSFVYTNGNYTEIQGQGLTASMGIVVSGRYGSVANAPKIYSSDETTGVAHIELVNGGGEIRLGVEKSTGGQILPGSSAYATVLTAGLSGRNLEFGTNNTKRMTIDGSTGAVTLTGALSGISATFSKANTSGIIDNNAYIRLVNTGTSTLNQSIDLVMRWQDGTYNGTGGISMVRESATARSGKLILQPIDSSGNNVSALTLASTGAATFSSSVTIAGTNDGAGTLYVSALSSTNAARLRNNDASYGTLDVLNSNASGFGIYAVANKHHFGGNVGIGTTSPAEKLDVNGYIKSSGSSSGFMYPDRQTGVNYILYGNDSGYSYFYNSSVGNVGRITMSNGIYTPLSDVNKKKDFEDSNIGLNEVMQLKPTMYRMKTDSSDVSKQLGFIAQEVKDYIPQAYEESGDFIGLNFNPIVAALTKAVQELKAELDTLKNK